ncbi:MAG: tRNA-binding protein [Thermoproteota archaeon]|nr:tRNA-binding protein [Thermoproteota archaeon]
MLSMDIVSYEDFKKLDIRLVSAVKAEPIAEKTRILKLTVDIGAGETRVMIAGGAEFYKPEDFVGKKFVALVNLAPRRISGVDSQGMLLAADAQGKPLWLTIVEDGEAGLKIT